MQIWDLVLPISKVIFCYLAYKSSRKEQWHHQYQTLVLIDGLTIFEIRMIGIGMPSVVLPKLNTCIRKEYFVVRRF